MQYADRQNAFQREAANMAIRQRVVGAHADDVAGNNGENAEVRIPPAQNHGNFMFPAGAGTRTGTRAGTRTGARTGKRTTPWTKLQR